MQIFVRSRLVWSSYQGPGQPGLHGETVFKKKKKKSFNNSMWIQGPNFILLCVCVIKILQLTSFIFSQCSSYKLRGGEGRKRRSISKAWFTVLTVPPINHLPIWAWKSTGHGLIAPAPSCQATSTRGKSEKS